jgi:hypothetical protein
MRAVQLEQCTWCVSQVMLFDLLPQGSPIPNASAAWCATTYSEHHPPCGLAWHRTGSAVLLTHTSEEDRRPSRPRLYFVHHRRSGVASRSMRLNPPQRSPPIPSTTLARARFSPRTKPHAPTMSAPWRQRYVSCCFTLCECDVCGHGLMTTSRELHRPPEPSSVCIATRTICSTRALFRCAPFAVTRSASFAPLPFLLLESAS